MENLLIYKKELKTFCRKVDGSRDIEGNVFFKMAATLIPIRSRQSRFKLRRHPSTTPAIILCSFFFHPISPIYWAVTLARRMPSASS